MKRLWKSGLSWIVWLAMLPVFAGGCAVKKTRTLKPSEAPRPALEATKEELLERYQKQVRAIRSLNAAVTMAATTGSAYSGVIEQYHEVDGFILAERPAWIRVIGQAPVVAKNIFDMASDGETFRIFIPSKNKFLEGPARAERRSQKPIENLRPQHLLDALFWPGIPEQTTVVMEEWNQPAEKDYILSVLRPGAKDELEIARKVWFDRADLNVSRLEIFGRGGRLESDVAYAEWQPAGDTVFPRALRIERPQEEYLLDVRVTKISLNEAIGQDRFRLQPPAGVEVVHVGGAAEGQP